MNNHTDTPIIEIKETRFGETMYKWQNHKHPDNPDFMQRVFWIAFQKPDTKYMIGYSLSYQSQTKWIEFGTGDVSEIINKYL